ncbi:MAG TPA: DUF4331 domain-containing protein [Actinomycetes bacterium]|nr:DUF4331 domain-containing protein [Actinomycetes bacterium]
MTRKRLTFAAVVAIMALIATLTALLPSGASSHREAPTISDDPVADNTDTYAFVSPDRPDTVTIAANWIPLEGPAGGPNFHKFGDDVRYRIYVDNNGDAIQDVTYEWRFRTIVRNPNTFLYNTGQVTSLDDPDLNIRQTYSVARIKGGKRTVLASGLPVPPANVGPRSTPNYDQLAAAGVKEVGGSRMFAGPRDDAFFVDLGSVFDLLGLRPLNQAHAIKLPADNGRDGVGGYNTHTIAIQVPITDLTSDGKALTGPKDPRAVIGVWATSDRQQVRVLSAKGNKPQSKGNWVQVSRLGMPLVNEVVIPLGQKDTFNASRPRYDAKFGKYVLDPEPARLINALYGLKVPPAPRNDMAAIFLTGIPGLNQPPNVRPAELLRLNMAVPPTPVDQQDRLGLLAGQNDGFPNGRRLVDDVTDIELRALAGGTPFTPDFNVAPNNALTDGVDRNDTNDGKFMAQFPYLNTPHQGYDHPGERVGP